MAEDMRQYRKVWGLTVLLGLGIFLVAIGAGFGIGWGARATQDTGQTVYVGQMSNSSAVVTNKLLPFSVSTPGITDEATLMTQWAIITPTLLPLARVLGSFIDGNSSNFVLLPGVLQYYFTTTFGSGPELANLYTLAQQLQANPGYFQVYGDVTTSLSQLFSSLSSNPLVNLGRRLKLDASNAVISKFLTSVLASAANSNANSILNAAFDPSTVPGMLVNVYSFVKVMVTDYQSLKYRQDYLWHYDPDLPGSNTTLVLNVNGSTIKDTNYLDVTAYPLNVNKGDINDVLPASGRRSLLQSYGTQAMQLSNIPGYSPGQQPASSLPPLRIPLIFHVMMYSNPSDSSGYGPPNWQSAAASCANLVWAMNNMGAPARISFWVQECRADPRAYPYLVIAGGVNGYNGCVNGNIFAILCGNSIIPNSAANFPRAINIYPIGLTGAPYTAYSYIPSSPTNAIYGHISMVWNAFDSVSGSNSERNLQAGGQALIHEIGHTLGLSHTFFMPSSNTYGLYSCIDSDGLQDTPSTCNAVWNIPKISISSYDWCQNAWNRVGNSFSVLYQRKAAGLGIRSDELNSNLRSCGSSSNRSPFVPNNNGDELGNYMTYSWDICFAMFGHFTVNQLQKMHQVTSGNNIIQYQWGQYYASLPLSALPVGINSYTGVAATPAPKSPPQPPGQRSPPPPPPRPPSPPPVNIVVKPSPVQQGQNIPPNAPFGIGIGGGGVLVPALLQRPGEAQPAGGYYQDPTASATAPGVWYSGCANLGGDNAICAVDKPLDCPAGVRNGWWDYCRATTCATEITTAPVIPGPATVALPPLPEDNCTAGGVTLNGFRCSEDPWTAVNSDLDGVSHSGCANPDSDPNGDWCSLVRGTLSATGQGWDYCQPRCTTPDPTWAACSTAVTSVPTGCTCATEWGFAASDGTHLTNLHGCTPMDLGGTYTTVMLQKPTPRARTSLFRFLTITGVVLLVALGAGFGAGWGVRSTRDKAQTVAPTRECGDVCASRRGSTTPAHLDSRADPNPEELRRELAGDHYVQQCQAPSVVLVNKLLPYRLSVPGVSDVQTANSQWAIISTSLLPLARVLAAFVEGNSTSFVLTGAVVRHYCDQKFGDGSAEVANLFKLAQQLQANPNYFQTFNAVTQSLTRMFASLRDNPLLVGVSGGRRLQQTAAAQIAKQYASMYVSQLSALEVSSGANATLGSVFDPSTVPDMLYTLYNFIKVMVTDYNSTKATQYLWHESVAEPPNNLTLIVDVDGNTIHDGGGVEVQAYPLVPTKGEILWVPASGSRRRRSLLQASGSASMKVSNIPPYNPGLQQPSSLPPLRIPVIFHVMLYVSPTDPTGYGPPNWTYAAASCANLIWAMNNMAAPAAMSFWAQDCRADPAAYPYLVVPNPVNGSPMDGYNACVNNVEFGPQCGNPLIANSAANFPRAINVYVIGVNGAPYTAYSYTPSSVNNALYGHISMVFTAFDSVDGSNNEQAFQSGGASLFHEVCHTLGLLHTFAPTSAPYDRSACVDADAVLDTPTTVNGVWDIPISTTAPYDWCCNAFDGVNDNFTVVYARKAAGLGARADEQTTALSSCQGTSSRLPYVPNTKGDELGNYMTYSWDPCFAMFGHLTLGQVQRIHAITSANNPIQYQWGQYYASLPPSQLPTGFNSYASLSASPPFPAPPPRPPAPPPPPTPPPPSPPSPPRLGSNVSSPPSVSPPSNVPSSSNMPTSPQPRSPAVTLPTAAVATAAAAWPPTATQPHSPEPRTVSIPEPTPSDPTEPDTPKPTAAISKSQGSGRHLLLSTPSTGCTTTQHDCACSSNWYYQDPNAANASAPGVWYSGCTNLGDASAWCAIDKAAGCSSGVRNGWWDYCRATTCATEVTTAPLYVRPAGVEMPQFPADNCTAGGVTAGGFRCSGDAWQAVDSDPDGTTHTGCANPDNDPGGAWCSLVRGTTTALGLTWDYCQPECTTARFSACTTAVTHVPAGCTCAPQWAFSATDGTYLTNLHGCSNITLGNTPTTVCQLACPSSGLSSSANSGLDGSFNFGCRCGM
ncbi:MAG: hypothetical protein WDW36_009214 [Sanguina aurantia]